MIIFEPESRRSVIVYSVSCLPLGRHEASEPMNNRDYVLKSARRKNGGIIQTLLVEKSRVSILFKCGPDSSADAMSSHTWATINDIYLNPVSHP